MKKWRVIHPLLFALFPVLFLFSHNVGRLPASATAIPSLVVLVLTLLLWGVLWLITRNLERSGIVVSVFVLTFFSFGHFFRAIEGATLAGHVVGRPQYALIAWAILFLCVVYVLLRTQSRFSNVTVLLNRISAVLVILTVANATYGILTARRVKEHSDSLTGAAMNAKVRPDIYYIILDGYARADVLKEIYGYDNSEFLDYLKAKGFYVATDSRPNYQTTIPSLASSLNFQYHDDLSRQMDPASKNERPLITLIKHNKTRAFLKKLGYLDIALSTGYYGTEIRDADIYLHPNFSLNEFQNALINTTPLPLVFDKLASLTQSRFFPVKTQYDFWREHILFSIDHLDSIPEVRCKVNKPVFVFAHILAPHGPFVLGANGEKINPSGGLDLGDHFARKTGVEKYLEEYKTQLIFVTKKIRAILDKILADSPEPPIIVLQGDHGPDAFFNPSDLDRVTSIALQERFAILNAYHLPNGGSELLYPKISPVNTFRIILKYYFAAPLDTLDDRSYLQAAGHPYDFIDVTDRSK